MRNEGTERNQRGRSEKNVRRTNGDQRTHADGGREASGGGREAGSQAAVRQQSWSRVEMKEEGRRERDRQN